MTPVSHHDKLDEIRREWRKSNRSLDLQRAKQHLEDLRARFHYVLAVGHELVLVLERLGEYAEAVALLEELGAQFRQPDEETLCRWGRIFKRKGERALSTSGDRTQAIHDFEQGRRYYLQAFALHRGFYPRINELTLRFLEAVLRQELGERQDAQRLLEDVRREAGRMLCDPAIWRLRKDDDNVWVPATKGEAAVLACCWKDAAATYAAAKVEAAGRQFYLDCMRDQVVMLVDAWKRLGVVPEEGLADPDEFFLHKPLILAPTNATDARVRRIES